MRAALHAAGGVAATAAARAPDEGDAKRTTDATEGTVAAPASPAASP